MVNTQGIWKLLAGCMLALVAMVAMAAPSALAADNYLFDAQHSVTGGCSTSVDDPIADPGCPYPSPPGGPSESFIRTTGVAIDSYGDVYVAVEGKEVKGPEDAPPHIDIFDADGEFINELKMPESDEPRTVAVDSEGYLYAYANAGSSKLLRYDPSVYNPGSGEIAYKTPATLVAENISDYAAIAVNPENDHLFVYYGVAHDPVGAIEEFGSGAEGNPVVNEMVEPAGLTFGPFDGPGFAIDAARDRIYVSDEDESSGSFVVQVLELGGTHSLIETIDGSSTPNNAFLSQFLSLAIDESTGNLYIYQQQILPRILVLTEKGQYLSTIEHNLVSKENKNQVAIDNGANSPNGALSTEGRYLWATTAPPGGIGHAYAFQPSNVRAPEVKGLSFSEVSEDEALLQATIDSGQAETTYKFEIVGQQEFDETGFDTAETAGEGVIPAGQLPVAVSAEATGLSAGSRYVFRIVIANEVDGDEAIADFKTFPSISSAPCPNDSFRTGPSATLPDCRAYELVTPADTSGRSPMGIGLSSILFPSLTASPDGSSVPFRIEGGLIPGSEGTASLAGDPYLATRTSSGWTSVLTGGKGTEASAAAPGGRSPDQRYSAWTAEGLGPAVVGGEATNYVRYPDGHSELFGRGSLKDDPHASPMLISENGGHMLFTSRVHLEEQSPPTGGLAVYDRTSDKVTHVVSLLPGNLPPSAAQEVSYRGSSPDGRGVAFDVSEGGTSTLYLRYNNEATYEVADDATIEGVAEGGKRILYLQDGSLFAFDIDGGKISFATSGNVTVVNVSAAGTTAYFVSPTKLTSKPNPLGSKAVTGKNNLYESHEGSIKFVGVVSEEDVVGEAKNYKVNGLGLWVIAVGGGNIKPGAFAADPSRTTADGGVLLFQSNLDLTDFESDGHRQVYRYDSAGGELTCVSCNPTGASPVADATLQDIQQSTENDPVPTTVYDPVQNLSSSGDRAFFQSDEPLVPADTDGLQDVYEWEAQGVGSCAQSDGCLYLISSGRSAQINYLYAASETGDDVFFSTADLLAPQDVDTTPSIYDARVGGGFPMAVSPECEGEGCRPSLTPAPLLPTPGSTPNGKSGNVSVKCPKGKKKVKRHGKVRCVKKKKHSHKRRENTGRKGAAR